MIRIRHWTAPAVLALVFAAFVMALAPNAASALTPKSTNALTVYRTTDYAVAPGVTETTVDMRNGSNQNVIAHVMVAQKNSDVAVKASYKGYYTKKSSKSSRQAAAAQWKDSKWGFEKTTSQAKAYESIDDAQGDVVGGVNADFFDMSTGRPLGNLIMEGNALQTNGDEPYFAVTKSGEWVVRDAGSDTSDVEEAVGGQFILVRNGQANQNLDAATLIPINSVGIDNDGNLVLVEVDGRQASSVGLTDRDFADALAAWGLKDMLRLDGGGSATFLSKREGTNNVAITNSPSDGSERDVSSALLLVRTARADGVFTHAAVSPSNEVYTPGSKIKFSAVGADKYGAHAELPNNATWQLDEASRAYGSIDAKTGEFTDNGQSSDEHAITAQLTVDGKVVGQSSITIAVPDQIEFLNDSVNLDYGEKTTLGMTVYSKMRAVHYKDGDFDWTQTTTGDNPTPTTAAGTFDGNTFIAAENNEKGDLSVQAVLTAACKWNTNVKASVTVGIGMAPQIVMDGGDSDGLDYNNIDFTTAGGTPAEGKSKDLVVEHYAGRGGVGSAEQVNDPTLSRFGNKCLRLNYDFTGCNVTTEGICVGFTENKQLPGSPTSVGVWVYAPANTPNYWLRMYVIDGNGKTVPINFTQEMKGATDGTKGGINWMGWKYLSGDLTGVQGPVSFAKGMTFRVMDLNKGKNENGRTDSNANGAWVCTKDDSGNVSEPRYIGLGKGYLLLDNMQLVYGNQPADTTKPAITSIQAGTGADGLSKLSDLKDGTELDDNTISFAARFEDPQNPDVVAQGKVDKHVSGIVSAGIKVDGKDRTDQKQLSIADGKVQLSGMRLPNGTHTVSIYAKDDYGNLSEVTRTFTVKGSNEGLTSVSLDASSNDAPLGGTVNLNVTSNKVEDVKSLDTVLKVGTNTPVDEKAITFAKGYAGTATYDAESGDVTIKAQRDENADSTGEGTIVTVPVKVPTNLSDPSSLSYQITQGEVEYTSKKSDEVVNTFATAAENLPVTAAYKLSFNDMVAGEEYGTVTVTDSEGNPAVNVVVDSLHEGADSTFCGRTSKDGTITVDFTSGGESEPFTLQGHGKKGYSFRVSGQTLTAAGTEDGIGYDVQANIAEKGDTQQNISWLSNPLTSLRKAVVKYAKTSDYEAKGEEAFKSVEGISTKQAFTSGASAANVNRATITGLDPATEYTYVVGDGEHWTQPATFHTAEQQGAGDSTHAKFFVIGDTQASGATEVGNLDSIISKINDAGGYDFGIQCGDAIESPTSYASWTPILDEFTKVKNADVLHVIGNHEEMGDAKAAIANHVFNTPNDTHYSATYGNVYVATMAYTDDADQLKQDCDWLVKDAAKSKATWKILTMHHPTYASTDTNSDADMYADVVSKACDEAGINAVFAGHEHTYARTFPMKGGKVVDGVDESKPDGEGLDAGGFVNNSGQGTAYFTCASTGEKSYALKSDLDEFFAKANETDDSQAYYLSVETDDENLTVTTYVNDEVVDRYTVKSTCAVKGHTYDSVSNGKLVCSTCGHKADPKTAVEGGFTGMVPDKTSGSQIWYIAGVPQTGLQLNGDKVMLFDKNGIGYTGKARVAGTVYYFDKGMYTKSSDRNAGDIEMGMCGADADGENLVFFYQQGNNVLNIGKAADLMSAKVNPYADRASGAMKDWGGMNDVPWQAHNYDVTTVNIGDGVENIGSYALNTNPGTKKVQLQGKVPALTTVNIPDSVTRIGRNAFRNCQKLTDVDIPNGVTQIGDYAFSRNYSLKSITIPEAVQSIGDRAFADCQNLSVTMKAKESIPTIATNAFKNSNAQASLNCSKAWVNFVKANKSVFKKVTYYNHATTETQKDQKAKKEICPVCGTVVKSTPIKPADNPGKKADDKPGKKADEPGKKADEPGKKNGNPGKKADKPSKPSKGKAGKSHKKAAKKTVLTKGKKFTSGALVYRVTTKGKAVKVIGAKNKHVKTVTIPTKAKYKGVSYSVTSVGKNAFKGYKSLKKVTIGKNVKSIGAKAFYKDKRLKSIAIASKKLTAKNVDSKAFKGVATKAKVRVPASKVKSYKKVLTNKGLSKKASVKKR